MQKHKPVATVETKHRSAGISTLKKATLFISHSKQGGHICVTSGMANTAYTVLIEPSLH